MIALDVLLENNKGWADAIEKENPGFFAQLAKQQAPEYLWIGCADSRVPANELVGLMPGEMFVHRNIANVVVLDDINCLSVLQFAIQVLKIKHVIVCGHYECGGVKAAYNNEPLGLIDGWLKHIRKVYEKNQELIESEGCEKDKLRRLCEKNVEAQVDNVCQTDFVKEAWASGQKLCVHGLIYNIEDGLLRNLEISREA